MKHDRCITIDLHGMTVSEARKRIQQLLKTCPKDTVQIEIIHGCNSGQALQKFVRRELKHPPHSPEKLRAERRFYHPDLTGIRPFPVVNAKKEGTNQCLYPLYATGAADRT